MSPQELIFRGQKIAQDFVSHGSDMNSAIAYLANSSKLNDDQIERVVEESNKAAFLISLEKTGKQIFDVASFEKVKENMKPIEKTAMVISTPKNYEEDPIWNAINQFRASNGIEKVAEEKRDFSEFQQLAAEAHSNISEFISMTKLAVDFELAGKKKYGNHYSDSELIKVAEKHNDTNLVKLAEIMNELPSYEANAVNSLYNMFSSRDSVYFIKEASLLWGEVNPLAKGLSIPGRIGAGVNAVTKGVVGTGATVAGKAGSTALKAGIGLAGAAIPLTAVLGKKPIDRVFNFMMVKHEGGKIIQDASKKGITGTSMIGPGADLFKQASTFEKTAILGELLPAIAEMAGPMLSGAASGIGKAIGFAGKAAGIGQTISGILPKGNMFKSAGWREGLQHVLDFAVPCTTMGWAGITATAAKKLGGGIALTMNQREFDQTFDTIIKHNPDLADRSPQIRQYFDIISQNAPSLAKNHLVAGTLVKNMDALGGVDFNTIKMMRETENLQGREKGLSFN